ncbi:MAG: hypothetical protein ACK41T_08625 [Pseudobdellovibrio sp.]
MINLASIKYKNILSEHGGPIDRLTYSQVNLSHNLKGYEATALLKADLRHNADKYTLYDNVDGMGSDTYKSIACYKAISEALERWAYYISSITQPNIYGFDIDNSTNGMAAFPDLLKITARRNSLYEALERWTLCEWWANNLAVTLHTINDINCMEIKIPPYGVTCISWKISNEKYVYGFASAKNFLTAFNKSTIELFRNDYVLSKSNFFNNNLNLQEQRLIFFSTKNGYNIFLEKVKESSAKQQQNKTPKLILSKEIIGPWSKYSTIWRSLFETTNQNNESVEVFLF